jgi:hypothetical protein
MTSIVARKVTAEQRELLKKRLSGKKRQVVGAHNDKGASDDESESDAASSEAEEIEDYDEQLEMFKFKDECWSELSSASLSDDIAALTGVKPTEEKAGDNIVVGFRIRPPRAVESMGEAPVLSSRGVSHSDRAFH